uniref:Peroxin-7 n=1 Tax=Timema bartmani TaxID=61472 RepID=A0A7R9I817_9NEOP|nr:unnamed protein product [Timema bartmani]
MLMMLKWSAGAMFLDAWAFPGNINSEWGCDYAVRRVKFSPHHVSVLASVSYDFTTRIWDFKTSPDALETVKHHSEFVYGLDFNTHVSGQIADCGWDSLVHVFNPRAFSALPPSNAK